MSELISEARTGLAGQFRSFSIRVSPPVMALCNCKSSNEKFRQLLFSYLVTCTLTSYRSKNTCLLPHYSNKPRICCKSSYPNHKGSCYYHVPRSARIDCGKPREINPSCRGQEWNHIPRSCRTGYQSLGGASSYHYIWDNQFHKGEFCLHFVVGVLLMPLRASSGQLVIKEQDA